MSQSTMNIPNQAGAGFRAAINAALQALVENNSGDTEPSETYPFMFWADSNSGYMKIRSGDDTAWISAFPLTMSVSEFMATILGSTDAESVRNELQVVALDGDQEVNGKKTFTSRPQGIINSSSRVSGLRGTVNSSSPLTKFDLSADEIVLQNSDGDTVIRRSSGTLTCDLGLAGPAKNGRDQLSAFAASTWIYLYFAWDGTALSTLASTTGPTSFTGSSLPSGCTHWAFATALRWNGSSNIVKCYARGAKVVYDVDTANAVLSAASATTFTTVSLATWIPPNALTVGLTGLMAINHSVGGTSFTSYIRATGSSISTGIRLTQFNILSTTVTQYSSFDKEFSPGANSSIDYRLSASPSGSGGVYLDVGFFTIPNGDV